MSLKLPSLDSIDSISLKKNADPLITISARNDMETILNILEKYHAHHNERGNRYACSC